MEKTLQFLERELQKIHTSRVSPSLVEDLPVDCFGQVFSLKQLAAISSAGPREIVIKPWDRTYIESIEKALTKSHLSATVVVEGDGLRLNFPPPSEEYRQDLIKKIHQIAEASRQTLRKWRQETWDIIQEKTLAGEIREDDKFRAKKELQDLIDKYQERVEKLVSEKENELKLK